MRHLWPGLALLAAVQAALAQLPPSINKPIDLARKNVNATNAQSAAVTQAGKPTPAAKQVEAAPKGGAARASAPAKDSSKVTFEREVFAYLGSGRRDPFASPIETGEIRPLIQDLSVVSIIYDARGNRSVAVMRDASTLQQYSAKVGQVLGRARVSQIRPQEVVLTIDEYGFSRQEILRLNVPGMNQPFRGKP